LDLEEKRSAEHETNKSEDLRVREFEDPKSPNPPILKSSDPQIAI